MKVIPIASGCVLSAGSFQQACLSDRAGKEAEAETAAGTRGFTATR